MEKFLKNVVEGIVTETLKMLEISDDTILEKQQQEKEDIVCKQEGSQLEEKSVKDIQILIKEIKKGEKSKRNKEVDKKIATILHGNCLSENFIKTFINAVPTDEHVRFLKILNLNEDDIDNLQALQHTKIRVDNSSDSINSTDSLSDRCAHLLPNSDYLKKVLSKPLIQALCEIVAKKPADPVEYLGHWLLHFKEVENKDLRIEQKEEESNQD